MPSNNLKIGDKVTVVGYDSTATFNHNFAGVVTDSNDETVKVMLNRGYHTRVAYQQCTLIPPDEDTGGASPCAA